VRGRIVGAPEVLEPQPNPFARWIPQSQRTAFVLETEAIECETGFQPVAGRLRVTVYEAILDLRAGEFCEVFGRLFALQPPANPGAFDWQMYSRTQGIVARLVAQHRENVRLLEPNGGRRAGPLAWLRRTSADLLVGDLPSGAEEESSLLSAMLLGQRSQLSERLNEVFIRSGCIHFISVSGVHLVIVMYLARLLCQWVGASRNASTWAMVVAIVVYACVAEPRPPILRAAIIGLIYCAARLLGRERAYLNWTSAAAIILLVINPLVLFDVGFQLSFAAVLGVAYLAPAIRGAVAEMINRLRAMTSRGQVSQSDRQIRARLRTAQMPSGMAYRTAAWLCRRCGQGLAVSGGAWLAGLPIIAATFYRVQPWGAINSLILMPFVTVAMALGFAKMFLSAVSPSLGSIAGTALGRWDAAMMAVVEAMAHLPAATVTVPPPPTWLSAVFCGFLVVWALKFSPDFTAARIGSRATGFLRPPVFQLPQYCTRASCCVLIAAAGAGWWIAGGEPAMRVTVLAVGRGSATVIELPGGPCILYDAGTSYASDVGRNVVIPFLHSRGIDRLDRLYVSHPNLDHFSGLPTILGDIDSGSVLVNSYFESRSGATSPSRHFMALLRDFGRPAEVIDASVVRWTCGGAEFELLWPLDVSGEPSANDTSNVIRISFDGRSILLTGDIDESAQEALVQRGGLSADVLVLPHHGSVRRTTRKFIEAVGAAILIRSSDERMADTFNGLVEVVADRAIYNTADHGAITVEVRSGKLTVIPTRSAGPGSHIAGD